MCFKYQSCGSLESLCNYQDGRPREEKSSLLADDSKQQPNEQVCAKRDYPEFLASPRGDGEGYFVVSLTLEVTKTLVGCKDAFRHKT